MRPKLLSLSLVLTASVACGPSTAQMPPAAARGITPSATPEAVIAPTVPVLVGVPQAVRVGLTVYLSGMVPVDSAGRLIGAGDLTAQTRQALVNLVAVVRAAGGVPGDIVKLTAYVKGLDPASIAAVRAAVLDGLDRGSPPALTVVGVTELPEPTMRVMLDGVAQLRSEFPDRTRMELGGRGRGGR